MVLAYFVSELVKKKIRITYSMPLLFCASILPDLDFLFGPFIPHHTVTHSITFWFLICAALVLIKRLDGLPYVIAILSHFLIGDIITGNPTLFYGLSTETFGNIASTISSRYGEVSALLYQSTVEAAMVGLFVILALSRKNFPSIFAFPNKHVLILGFIVLLILVSTLKKEIVYVALNQSDSIYAAYAIIAFSELIFAIAIVKGTATKSVKRPLTL